MPVPASDAIASDVGHGALGIRSGLRPFRDLLAETVGQRHLWVELRPKKVYATWTNYEAGPVYSYYKSGVTETFDGVALDIVGVKTLTETLARVESQSRCSATAGTYYYGGSTLHIHLTADANPSGTTVAAELGIYVGSHGVHQPVLLPDRLSNGSLESWTGSSPDGWGIITNVTAGTITLDKTTSDPLEGSYAARITFTAATGYKGIKQDFTDLAAGAVYRVSAAYRNTCATNGMYALLQVLDPVSFYGVTADGRGTALYGTALAATLGDGEWKRLTFDFVCPSWTTVRVFLWAQDVSGAVTGTVDFDDVKLECISRHAYHEPLLSIDSLPTLEAARADSFWGPMSAAIGGLSMANAGGLWSALLASYDWLGAQAIFRVGGRYQLGGNEIPMEDCPVIATAKLGPPTVSDSRVSFDLEDDRNILLRTLPIRTYNNNGRDAYTQADRGRSRPLLWGLKTGMRPVQYDIHYTGGGPVPLGQYELVDCTDWTPGLNYSLTGYTPTIYWYENDNAALARSSAQRTEVAIGTLLTAATFDIDGEITVKADMRPLVITSENNKLHFDIGGSTLTATIAVGTYYLFAEDDTTTLQGFLRLIRDAMRSAASASDIQCDFVDSTQKVQISKDAGTLNLRCATGADAQMGIWALLGFDAATDKTGALTYNADNVFTWQAYDQIIRVDAYGFKDDTSGTYTGTASAAIEKAPDIARHILQAFLKVPVSAIDTASFVATRGTTWGAKPCSLYIGAPRTVAEIFNELEASGNMDLVLKGGVWYCLARDTSVPAGTPDLVDSDYLSFEAGYDPEDLYGTVTLTYNEAPDGGQPVNPTMQWVPYKPNARTEMGETTDAGMALRYDRPNQKTLNTCLRDKADAAYPLAGSRLEAVAAQAQTKRRRFRFSTKGKALQVPVNGKIRLTRTKGLDTTGALSNVLVRVLRKRDDWARWLSEVDAVEVV